MISINYLAKIDSKFLKLLNSKTFSLGSLINIVACSPFLPLNRIYGSTIKSKFLFINFCDNSSQFFQSNIIPKCRTGIFFLSTLLVSKGIFFLSIKWADIWCPKKSKSTHLNDSLPISHPIASTYHFFASSILYTGKAKWNGFSFLIEAIPN